MHQKCVALNIFCAVEAKKKTPYSAPYKNRIQCAKCAMCNVCATIDKQTRIVLFVNAKGFFSMLKQRERV